MHKVLGIWVAVALVVVAAGCGTTSGAASSQQTSSPSTTSKGPVKVVFLYNNPPSTPGWESTFEQARTALESKYGSKIEASYVVAPESPQAATAIDQAVANGANVIVGTSYGHGKYLIAASKKYPNVNFIVSQFAPPAGSTNFSGYDMGVEDAWYLTGMSVGAVMKNEGKTSAGWVDAFAIPYDLRELNGFTLGLQKMDPGATTHVVMTNSWYDPNKEAQAANSLISSGVGAVAEGIGSSVVAKTANQAVAPFAGVYPLTTYAPKSYVTGPEYSWQVFFEPCISALIASDKCKSGFTYGGLKAGAIHLQGFGPGFKSATSAQRAQIQQAEQDILSGKLTILPGSPTDLESVDYVVPGVSGVHGVKTQKVVPSGG